MRESVQIMYFIQQYISKIRMYIIEKVYLKWKYGIFLKLKLYYSMNHREKENFIKY